MRYGCGSSDSLDSDKANLLPLADWVQVCRLQEESGDGRVGTGAGVFTPSSIAATNLTTDMTNGSRCSQQICKFVTCGRMQV